MRVARVAAYKPLPKNPTTAHLAGGIEQVHACLEDFKKAQATSALVFSSQLTSLSGQLQAADEAREDIRKAQIITDRNTTSLKTTIDEDLKPKIDALVQTQATLAEALGLTDEAVKMKKPVALMTQFEAGWKGALAVGSGIGAFFTVWKLLAWAIPHAVIPGFWSFIHFVVELNKYVTG